jgi:5'-deoxynucleotidase
MRTVTPENVQEHSYQVAIVSHMLTLISNKKFKTNISPEKVALVALYHDASEVITGDMPSPIKYFNNEIANEYKKIEAIAEKTLLDMIPEEFKDEFAPLLLHNDVDKEIAAIVKSADVICGYLKTIEEISAGNLEFEKAKNNIAQTLEKHRSPAVDYFMDIFVPSFSLNLDEISTKL